MSFLIKAKLAYDQFLAEAKTFKLQMKYYTVSLDQVTMYMFIPVGSSGLMFMYYGEERGDEVTLNKIVDELKQLGFIRVESLDIPLP